MGPTLPVPIYSVKCSYTMLIPRMLSRENEGKNHRETMVCCAGVKA